MNIVISQSMYFPWVGLLEQIQLADIFVHYDDVQFSKGSFSNRVKVKTKNGSQWMTIPLEKHHLGQKINETLFNNDINWRQHHLDLLAQTYRDAPYCDEMLTLVRGVLQYPAETLADISRESILALCRYFDLFDHCHFLESQDLLIEGRSSQRVHDIVRFLKGTVYITGHGAQNYLDCKLFAKSKISIKMMQYQCISYPQQYGTFTPYVSSLDLIANCGKKGSSVIQPKVTSWENIENESD